MNGVKRVIFNQVINEKDQLEHVSAFMEIAIRNPKRKFRLIIEELNPIDTKADTKVMATLRPK